MRCRYAYSLSSLILGILLIVVSAVSAKEVDTLPINAPAPELNLPGLMEKHTIWKISRLLAYWS